MSAQHTFSVDPFGGVIAKGDDGRMLKSQSVETLLLYEILQLLRTASKPSEDALPEAVEWETLDGTERTTDKAMAKNWASAVGVRVVRRAVIDKARDAEGGAR
jgi:hypothetical protein